MFPLSGQNYSALSGGLSNLMGGGQSMYSSPLGGAISAGNWLGGPQQTAQSQNLAGQSQNPSPWFGGVLNQGGGNQPNSEWQSLINMLLQKLGMGNMGGGSNPPSGGAFASLGPYGAVSALGALAPFALMSGIYGR